jgi:glycosyl transferase family 25
MQQALRRLELPTRAALGISEQRNWHYYSEMRGNRDAVSFGAGLQPVQERVQVLAVSLPSAVARRRLMQAQLDAPGMPPYRLLDAVDGRKLTGAERARLYDDDAAKRYYGHAMTEPEIGCAASHFAAYRYISNNRLPWAVVLEDDALLGHQFPSVVARVAQIVNPSKPQAVLLSHVLRYSAWGAVRVDRLHQLYRPYEVYGAHAYLITLAGAQAMLAAFPQIRTVADDWRRFRRAGILEVLALVPYLVGTSTFSTDSQMGGGRREREHELRVSETLISRWMKRYVWRRFVFQLLVKPALRLHQAEQTW